MRKYIATAFTLFAFFLSGCELEPKSIAEDDLAVYRIIIKSVSYSSNTFTVKYVFNSYNGSDLDGETWFMADYEGTESFRLRDWILSPNPAAFGVEYSWNYFSFNLNKGETVPATITFDTTKPFYMRKKASWNPSIPGTAEETKELTVGKAYIETEVVPVTILK